MKNSMFLASLVIVIVGAEGMTKLPIEGASSSSFNQTLIEKVWDRNFKYDSKEHRFICRDKGREKQITARTKAFIFDERLLDAVEAQPELSDSNDILSSQPSDVSDISHSCSDQSSENSLKNEVINESDSNLIQENENTDDVEYVEVMQTRSGKSYKRLREEDFRENINKGVRSKRERSYKRQKNEDLKESISEKETIDYEGLVREIVELKKVSEEINKEKRDKLSKKYEITYYHCLRFENAVTNWFSLSEKDRNIFIKKIRNPKNTKNLELKTISGKLLCVDVLIELINGGKIGAKDFSEKKDYATSSTHKMNAKVWKILIENNWANPI